MIRTVPDPSKRRVNTTPMRDRAESWIARNRTDLPGRTSLLMEGTEEVKESTSIPHDQPRASSRINDNYCVTKLQARLLAGSPSPQTRQTINTQSDLNVNCHFAKAVFTAPGFHKRKM